MMGFTCDQCGAEASGSHDGYGDENAPKGWVKIQTEPLHVAHVLGGRSGTTWKTLCPACNVPGFWGRAAARASARLERIATAFDPVREWYEGEGDRPLAEMLTDAIADLQRDRAAALHLRMPLKTFVLRMEESLRSRDEHRGARGWIEDSLRSLVRRVGEELEELKSAVAAGSRGAIQKEASDVANFCMMISDVCDEMNAEAQRERQARFDGRHG